MPIAREHEVLKDADVMLMPLLAVHRVLAQDHAVCLPAREPATLSRHFLLLVGDDGSDSASQDVVEGCSELGINRCKPLRDRELLVGDVHVLGLPDPQERLISPARDRHNLVSKMLLPLRETRGLRKCEELHGCLFLDHDICPQLLLSRGVGPGPLARVKSRGGIDPSMAALRIQSFFHRDVGGQASVKIILRESVDVKEVLRVLERSCRPHLLRGACSRHAI